MTSLPSRFGIGDLGPAAHRWIDFLAEAGQHWWQVLPLHPSAAPDHSPYCPASAFAGNPLLISPELLAADGWLSPAELSAVSGAFEPVDRVDWPAVERMRRALLERASERLLGGGDHSGLDDFREQNAAWLEPFARFRVDAESGDRHRDVLCEIAIQYFFDEQWRRLRRYAHSRRVRIFGDMPYYVDRASADVRSHPQLFKLRHDGRPAVLSGVPPDAFSATGQLWGNPVYDWNTHARDEYAWWVSRIRRAGELFDLVRIDHFRALVAHWEVPAGHATAIDGAWADGPGAALLDAVRRQCGPIALVAEDLGIITDDVRDLMQRFNLPGMKVLQFAFDGGADSPYLPHNHVENAVVYTGTHDNNTARGWFDEDASSAARAHLWRYLGRNGSSQDVSEAMVRMAMMSVCRLSILPVQDVLGLGAQTRMNRPASRSGNWSWRLDERLLTPEVARLLLDMTEAYGRT